MAQKKVAMYKHTCYRSATSCVQYLICDQGYQNVETHEHKDLRVTI